MLDFFGVWYQKNGVKQLMITNVCDDCPERNDCHRRKSIDPAFLVETNLPTPICLGLCEFTGGYHQQKLR